MEIRPSRCVIPRGQDGADDGDRVIHHSHPGPGTTVELFILTLHATLLSREFPTLKERGPMILRVQSIANSTSKPSVSLRCPGCGQVVTLEPVGQFDVSIDEGAGKKVLSGQRRCPNSECRALIFVVLRSGKLVASYPPERLDFDATSLPDAVRTALEEAVVCHSANCFIASAIMVRKTLEELCADKNASGKNLKDKLRALGPTVVIPTELLDGLDDLRLLGNDAAHIESQTFIRVGREEVEVGIEFAKEVLKAVYQYSNLLTKLRALKK